MFKHSSCCIKAKTIYIEGVMEVKGLACLLEHFLVLKTFTFPNICLFLQFDKTHNDCDTI